MNFRLALLILTCTVSIHETLPVIIEVDTIETFDRRKITFFSDKHIQSPGEQEQITSLINFLQKTRATGESFHILAEQALELYKRSASSYQILYTLDKHIETAQPPMTHVKLDNIEVRCITGLVMGFLDCYEYYKDDVQYKTDSGKKTIHIITFQDILDEFDNLKQSLSSYYLGQTNQTISNIYTYLIEKADRDCEQFKRKISNRSDIVFEYAKAAYNKKVLETVQPLHVSEEKKDLAKILGKDIESTFNHLFNLNLLKNILTSDSQNILVFAGGYHTSEVISLLITLDATSIFHASNYELEERIEKTGNKTRNEVAQPITGLQIVQALSAQPKKISSCTPIMCYMTIAAAALYYLMFVVIPGQTLYGCA